MDNEQGRATGRLPGQLSAQGQVQARQLGRRREGDGITAVFSSGLARAAQTASIAFGQSAIPVLLDRRLRECDYGSRNGMPASEVHASRFEHRKLAAGRHPRQPLSHRPAAALERVPRLGDRPYRHLVGLDHFINGVPLEKLARENLARQEGREYRIS